MSTVHVPSKDIPVLYHADIVVCGAGPAGIGAAVFAARSGKKVVIIEAAGCLGGMGTAGLVPAIIHMTDGVNMLAKGVCVETVDELARRMNIKPNYGWHDVQPELLKRVYDDMVAAAGIKVYLGMPIADVIKDGERVTGVVVSTKHGLKAVTGSVFIDATGDANVAAFAGVPFEVGDEKGRTMSPSLCVQYAGVDWEKFRANSNGVWSVGTIWKKLVDEGKAPMKEYHFVGFFKNGNSIGSGNLGHIYGINCLNEDDITFGYTEGRKIAEKIHGFYRDNIPGFEKSEIVNTASVLSVRETRRIAGEYKLCFNDYTSRASFEDEVGRFAYPIDIHSSSTDSDEQKEVEKRLHSSALAKGESYGIPYRALIAKNTSNLLVAGRSISCDREIQSSIRVMPGCFVTGQAAGAAASIATEKNGAVRSVPAARLQETLRSLGAYLK
ncbi:MAG: FAD-dependent oxidoreductase [Spirochaetes bacterium]|nr:FAD-dependent oxidoreductase [Spirochaetota bacterium]